MTSVKASRLKINKTQRSIWEFDELGSCHILFIKYIYKWGYKQCAGTICLSLKPLFILNLN